MLSLPHNIWWLRIATFTLAALAAASAAYWALNLSTPAPVPPSDLVFSDARPTSNPQVLAQLLGGGQAGAAPVKSDASASRLKLTGVVANRGQDGYALIAIDEQPAKHYRVGSQVSDKLMLQSVAPRSAALAIDREAPVSVTLDLPALSKP
jgi:general secretion pathway protein C